MSRKHRVGNFAASSTDKNVLAAEHMHPPLPGSHHERRHVPSLSPSMVPRLGLFLLVKAKRTSKRRYLRSVVYLWCSVYNITYTVDLTPSTQNLRGVSMRDKRPHLQSSSLCPIKQNTNTTQATERPLNPSSLQMRNPWQSASRVCRRKQKSQAKQVTQASRQECDTPAEPVLPSSTCPESRVRGRELRIVVVVYSGMGVSASSAGR